MTKDPEYGKMEEDAYNMAAAYTGTENLLAVKDDYIEGAGSICAKQLMI